MIECVFTVDYEIYGNGEGSLKKLVHEPAEKMERIFERWNAGFVLFIECAELELIETNKTDGAIDLVKHQIRNFYGRGVELGLHLHPQWYNSKYDNGKWRLDYSEYSLCTLTHNRIIEIINRSIEYMQKLLGVADFIPFSFRAGNWLFQPSQVLAETLMDAGIKIDSSVFKGGLLHRHGLDYRRALKNGYYWDFSDDVNVPVAKGKLTEFPVYTKMVPIWKLFTSKRIGLQQKSPTKTQTREEQLLRVKDFLRLYYPLKFDFCRMNIRELSHLLEKEIQLDKRNPSIFRPIVAIGHTKDLVDFETVDTLLGYLRRRDITISTLKEVYNKSNIGSCSEKS